MKIKFFFLVLISMLTFALFVFLGIAHAQVQPPPSIDMEQDRLDAILPDIPASDMLDSSPIIVNRPTDMKAFTLNVPIILHQKNATLGVGLTSNPVRAYLWERDWSEPPPRILRALSGLRVSMALAYIPNPDAAISEYKRIVIGGGTLSYEMVNQRDPLTNPSVRACMDSEAKKLIPSYVYNPRQEWGLISNSSIENCFHNRITYAAGFGAGMTKDFAKAWMNYEVQYRQHAFTLLLERRFMDRYAENTWNFGLRYTRERAFFSPSSDIVMEVEPARDTVESARYRFASGSAITFGLPKNIGVTLGVRVITPYSARDDGTLEYRGYIGLSWGSYDISREYLSRSMWHHMQ